MILNIFFYFVVFMSAIILNKTFGHVALTFPRARNYDLDFFDNISTPGPCGMPKGSTKTSFLSGSNFNVTWQLAYPQKGGFRIQILDELERPLIDLTPVTKQSQFFEAEATAQSYAVILPSNFTCTDCTLRLLREAEEWGSNYRLWSCADIDIVDKKSYKEDCSGHGRPILGRCRCERLHHGARCQYKEECFDDSDCGIQGACIDNGGTTPPTKQCFCNIGWFGSGCNKRSPMKNVDLDLQSYAMKRFSEDFIFYWRILHDKQEFEGVMVANNTSWVGVGWKPDNLLPLCKAYPEISEVQKPSESLSQLKVTTGKKDNENKSEIESKLENQPHKTSHQSQHSYVQSDIKLDLKTKNATTVIYEPIMISKPETEQKNSEDNTGENKQFAKADVTSVTSAPKEDVTVQTSVTYRISTHHGKPTDESVHITLSDATNSHEATSESESASTLISETEVKSEHKRKPETKSEYTSEFDQRYVLKQKQQFISEPEFQFKSKLQAKRELEIESEQTFTPESMYARELKPNSKIKLPEPKLTYQFSPKSELVSMHNDSKSQNGTKPNLELISKADLYSELEKASASESLFNPEYPLERKSVSKLESKYNTALEPQPKHKYELEPFFHLQGLEQQNSTMNGETKAEQLPMPRIHKYASKHDFNSMDCSDMVIGMAIGLKHRIGDYYTRGRSTPRLDTYWGGKDSLTAAMGFEKDGVTTILFRKKIKPNDGFTDHQITDNTMQVLWAIGQSPGKYTHNPSSGKEQNNVSLKDFYKLGELKYHGHGSQRGVVAINLFDEMRRQHFSETGGNNSGSCEGEWRYPNHCSKKNFTCQYLITWTYTSQTDEIQFTVLTKNIDTWTGVGFSKNEKMSQTDTILGWVDKTTGRPFLMDAWLNGYSSPILDSRQDIYAASGNIENGETTLKFTRKRVTSDNERDLAFTDDQCLYLMFPVKGGSFNPVNKKIRIHEKTPIVSAQKVCIKSCRMIDEEELATKTSVQLYYDVKVKLIDLGDDFIIPQEDTELFMEISNKLSSPLAGVLENLPGYSEIKLIHLHRDVDNGIIAGLKLSANKQENLPSSMESFDMTVMIQTALKDLVDTGKIGSFSVDRRYFVLTPYQASDFATNEVDAGTTWSPGFLFGSTKLYIIIGCLGTFLAFALLQAGCTLYKASKRKSTKDHLITKNTWRDYSSGTNTNMAFEAFETEEKARPPSMLKLPYSRETKLNDHSKSSHSSNKQNSVNEHVPENNHYSTEFLSHASLQQSDSATAISISGSKATYSLPRTSSSRIVGTATGTSTIPAPVYYTQDRRNTPRPTGQEHVKHCSTLQPDLDFYFMPSQRKYSGDVVRVYVDYESQT